LFCLSGLSGFWAWHAIFGRKTEKNKFEKKNKDKGNRFRRFALRASLLAFGRAVGQLHCGLDAGLKPRSISKAKAKAKGKDKGKRQRQGNSKGKGSSKGNGKGKGKRGGACGLLPTHRKMRDGWGTRAVLAGWGEAKTEADPLRDDN
jgi:hypothetical protein